MAFVSAEYCKTLQKAHDAKFWKVLDSSGKVCINKLDSDIGLSASQDMLQETLENCIGDHVIVKLYTIKPERKEAGVNSETGLTLKVRLEGSSQMGFYPGKQQTHSMGQPSWSDFMQMNEKVNQLNMDKLRMELEQDKEDSPLTLAINKAIENPQLVISALGAIFGKLNGNAAGPVIAQPTNSTISETLERLSKVDPDYQNTLAKMTAYLETNPGVIDQIKPIFGA